MKNKKDEVYELYPTKKVAPAILGYLAAFLYLAIAVCCIIGLVKFDSIIGKILLVFAGVSVVFLIIITRTLAWEKKAEIYKKSKDEIYYDVYDIVAGFNDKSTTVIKDIIDVDYNSKTDICKVKCLNYLKGKEKKAKDHLIIKYCTPEVSKFLKEQIGKK